VFLRMSLMEFTAVFELGVFGYSILKILNKHP